MQFFRLVLFQVGTLLQLKNVGIVVALSEASAGSLPDQKCEFDL